MSEGNRCEIAKFFKNMQRISRNRFPPEPLYAHGVEARFAQENRRVFVSDGRVQVVGQLISDLV